MAVVFHFYPTSWIEGDLPHVRLNSQHYVAWINEHATFTKVTKRLANMPSDYFNLSMTYRLDSHVPLAYMKSIELPKGKQHNLSHIFQRVKRYPKKKLVAWFVSHCKTVSDRESYVKELKRFISVDVFGACGPLKCGPMNAKYSALECSMMLERDYKFYLSFENSICKDYVTEKFERTLRYDIIPVTLGGANYSQVAPPHSHINALEFSSPEQLAMYLKYLAKNEEEYLKYFEWKTKYTTHNYVDNRRDAFCRLCAIINGKIPYKRHIDFKSWWLPEGVCLNKKFSFK